MAQFRRYLRLGALLGLDMLLVAGAYVAAYWLRLESEDAGLVNYRNTLIETLPWLLGIRALCGILVRQHNWSFRYASLPEAVGLTMATVAGSILFFAVCHFGRIVLPPPPRTVYPLEFALSLMGMGAVRYGPRYIYQLFLRRGAHLNANGEARLRTLIFGAGHTGELILRDLLRTRVYPYKVVGLVDDDPARWNASIHGCRVLGGSSDLPELIRKHRVDKLLIATPNISPARLREIVDLCADHHVRFKIVPPYAEVVAKGDAAPLALKDLQLEDLLARESITFDHARMTEFFVDKTVLVTGAAGSIGSEICRQVAQEGLKRLVALDVNENDLYFLNLELQEIAPRVEVVIEVASIRDKARLGRIFSRHQPQIVFHAAAHKHVSLMEHCPAEAIKNNVFGTRNVAECASEYHAQRFVLISTDKAVRPTSVMGASKHLAEIAVRELDERTDTRFMAVRFGNVLGSNGSLVPILKRQIEKGGPVTITHPKITRYFMTIPEAVGLVLVALVQDEGTVCVLDMGEPLSVDNLARQMISLSGLIPEQDIKIVYTGLRPGEKMYEELFTHDEKLSESSHPKIRLAHMPDEENLAATAATIQQDLQAALADGSGAAIREVLSKHVSGYTPEANAPAS